MVLKAFTYCGEKEQGLNLGMSPFRSSPPVVLKSPPFFFHVKPGPIPKGGARERFETFESFIG